MFSFQFCTFPWVVKTTYNICQLCFTKSGLSNISRSLSCFKSFAIMSAMLFWYASALYINYANLFKTQFCILNKWFKTFTRYWGIAEDLVFWPHLELPGMFHSLTALSKGIRWWQGFALLALCPKMRVPLLSESNASSSCRRKNYFETGNLFFI